MKGLSLLGRGLERFIATFRSRPSGVSVLVLGLFISAYVWRTGTVLRDSAGTAWPITREQIESVWFASNQDLFFVEKVEEGGLRLWQYRFQDDNWVPIHRFSLDLLRYAQLCGQASIPFDSISYNISRDGRKIVLGLRRGLCVLSIDADPSSVVRIESGRAARIASRITSVAFLGPEADTIFALFEDGVIKSYDAVQAQVKEWGTSLREVLPATSVEKVALVPVGRVLIAAALDLGIIACGEGMGSDVNWRFVYVDRRIKNSVSVSAMSCRQIIVGASDGYILHVKGKVNSRDVMKISHIDAGAVRALAFVPSGEVLAGGDFDAVYMVEEEKEARELLSVPPGTRLLAAGEKKLAYVNAGLFVVQLEPLRELNGRGAWITAILGVLLSFLGLVLAFFPPKT
jgi:hypothetical protein